MRFGKLSYFADFVVYPAVILTLAGTELLRQSSFSAVSWTLACLAGLLGWTFLEYFFHRFVMHQVPIITRMHDVHHASPGAFVGTPTWLSLSGIGFGVFLPLWLLIPFGDASGATTGVMLGYLWYGCVHYSLHHWQLDQSSFLYQAKLRHAAHHQGRQSKNFGVTTDLWDHVFCTAMNTDKTGNRER